ncbi:hypothetical protein POTOM_053605 [Populus tomentosa]|uniref:Retrovirus-related Pol polyprotein from transposon TNT 1-94-like beta-barrel domain-containing protein n=1 Tax=Populus tomentosa TaxID=118781 RepID=A0A8X7Y635_POPTO|nr:hypothetical protein POTOM_053605 [Populus tomentosa]
MTGASKPSSSSQATIENVQSETTVSVKLAIDGRGKLSHLNGEVSKPEADDPNLKTWRSENSLEAVRDMYSDLENSSQIFYLKSKLWQSRQRDREVTTYYNQMVTLWQELDLCYEDDWDCPNDSVRHRKREENDRVYVFLAGLNHNLDEVRDPEPKSNLEIESSALVSRGSDSDGDRRKKPWCDHCKKPWHTKETCWKIQGQPQNFKKKNGNDGRAFQTMSEDSQGPQINSEMPNFTKEQLGHMYKLFQSPQFSNPSCSLAQQGNKKIKIVDGSLSAIAGKGSVFISPSLTLHNVLHVPNLSCNLLSIRLDITTSDMFFKSLDGSSSLPSHNQNDSDTDNGNKKSNNQNDSCQPAQFISNSSFESCDDLDIPIDTLEIPKNIQEALQVPEWKNAILKR